jgi:hypothetical protein
MKYIKLFEQFINEASDGEEWYVVFNKPEFDAADVQDDPIWKEIGSGAIGAPLQYSKFSKSTVLYGIKDLNVFLKYVDKGIFDKQYKCDSFDVVDSYYGSLSKPNQMVVCATSKNVEAQIKKMGWLGGGDDFVAKDTPNHDLKEMDLNVQSQMVQRYNDWERGLIKAWGGILYLDYHSSLPSRGKTQPLSDLKQTLKEFYKLDKDSPRYEEMEEWIQEGGSVRGVPLFTKTLLDKIFNDIAAKTPAPFDFVIYRTSTKEQDGVNSYSGSKGLYSYVSGTERAYLIKKGTPVIFAGIDADQNEIIWVPSRSDLKNNRIA